MIPIMKALRAMLKCFFSGLGYHVPCGVRRDHFRSMHEAYLRRYGADLRCWQAACQGLGGNLSIHIYGQTKRDLRISSRISLRTRLARVDHHYEHLTLPNIRITKALSRCYLRATCWSNHVTQCVVAVQADGLVSTSQAMSHSQARKAVRPHHLSAKSYEG